ncbi:MAG: 30S ribosomal protein S2 [Fervidobacterium sp.]
MTELLIDKKEYLTAGIHIGMKSKNKDMERFIYKIREDGLAVLNLKIVNDRIKTAADFLSRAKTILVVGRKSNVHEPIRKFAEAVENVKIVVGRFMPGTLTNPNYDDFVEPDVVVLSDPQADYQALKEAVESRIPVVAMCDTFNETKNIDYVIPCNNKGKKSLALIFWILAKQINEAKGKDFKLKPEDFGSE